MIRYWRRPRDTNRKAQLVVEKLIQLSEKRGTAERFGLMKIEVSERVKRKLGFSLLKKESSPPSQSREG